LEGSNHASSEGTGQHSQDKRSLKRRSGISISFLAVFIVVLNCSVVDGNAHRIGSLLLVVAVLIAIVADAIALPTVRVLRAIHVGTGIGGHTHQLVVSASLLLLSLITIVAFTFAVQAVRILRAAHSIARIIGHTHRIGSLAVGIVVEAIVTDTAAVVTAVRVGSVAAVANGNTL
jgi:hypothetical protein